ncbi:MAG: LCP family protein [Candidatus Limnocylindrales bacterium]
MRQRKSRSPAFSALLSFLWPGLGQLYAGRRVLALIFAIPAVAAVAVVFYESREGAAVLAARFLDPEFAWAAFVAVVALGLWRLLAVIHAFVAGNRDLATRTGERSVLVVLLLLIVASHAAGAVYLWSAHDIGAHTFGGGSTNDETAVVPVTGSRTTILLTGLDQFSTRSEQLYDSIMVVSFDRDTNRVAMVSLPRDTAGFPFYWGGTSKIKINALPTYVRNGWINSPDQPFPTLVKEVSYLVGVPINYYGVVNLANFMTMIDMVGGIDINNPGAINDPTYDWLDGSPYGFKLAAGNQHLDGRHALAYARSRHGSGNSDYARAGRQQQLLVALEHKMATPSVVINLPTWTQQAGSLIRTDFPASQVADMVAAGQKIPSTNIEQYVLGPPYSVSSATATASTSCLMLDKVAPLSIKLFGQDSRYYGKTQAPTC